MTFGEKRRHFFFRLNTNLVYVIAKKDKQAERAKNRWEKQTHIQTLHLRPLRSATHASSKTIDETLSYSPRYKGTRNWSIAQGPLPNTNNMTRTQSFQIQARGVHSESGHQPCGGLFSRRRIDPNRHRFHYWCDPLRNPDVAQTMSRTALIMCTIDSRPCPYPCVCSCPSGMPLFRPLTLQKNILAIFLSLSRPLSDSGKAANSTHVQHYCTRIRLFTLALNKEPHTHAAPQKFTRNKLEDGGKQDPPTQKKQRRACVYCFCRVPQYTVVNGQWQQRM